MNFKRVAGGHCDVRFCIMAEGAIDRHAQQDLADFAESAAAPEGSILFLNSLGGDHVGGIALGREIRRRGFDTFVAAYDAGSQTFTRADCASACVYAFMGGVSRGAELGSKLGVHQLAIDGAVSLRTAISDAQWYMSLAAVHLQQMGATPDVLALALKMPSDGVYWLSRSEIRRFNVITSDAYVTRTRNGAFSFWTVTGSP